MLPETVAVAVMDVPYGVVLGTPVNDVVVAGRLPALTVITKGGVVVYGEPETVGT